MMLTYRFRTLVKSFLLVIVYGGLLSACQPVAISTRPEAALPTAIAVTLTPQPPPTFTLVPPSPFPTVIPTATPIPHPMSIAALRAGSYPGSEIVIERELERGANYRRYYAYYLSEGLKIYALLTIPNGTAPEGGWPAIVFNHGYISPDVYRTTERYIAYVDRLARAGYVVFRIDYRGHDRSEGEPTGAYGDPGYLVDVLNAITALQQHPQVNPDKIGMWGHSMGGYLTLRAMVVSREIKAGVIWAGVVASYPEMIYNWRRAGSFVASPSSRGVGWRTDWLETYGAPENNPEFWDSLSANTYLSDLSGPLQLHHGSDDEEVPVEFSIRLAEQARAAGQTAELYLYEGDNHNISKFFTTAMDRTIAFFDRLLK